MAQNTPKRKIKDRWGEDSDRRRGQSIISGGREQHDRADKGSNHGSDSHLQRQDCVESRGKTEKKIPIQKKYDIIKYSYLMFLGYRLFAAGRQRGR